MFREIERIASKTRSYKEMWEDENFKRIASKTRSYSGIASRTRSYKEM